MPLEEPKATIQAVTAENGAKLPRTRGLMPPWPKGVSGNPRGLAKDGGGSKDHPIRATLRKRLAKRRNLLRLVDTWIDAACDGDSAAREQILKRLDPVVEDSTAGKTILEGLKLELSPGKATLTVARANGEPLCSAQNTESIEACPSDPALPALQLPEGQASATADPAPQ